MLSRSRRLAAGRVLLGWATLPLALGAGVLVYSAAPMLSRSDAAPTAQGAPVRRGPLRIAVTASGGLNAADTVRMTSGVEGRTTILSLATEGTEVRAGDLVCELDATAMVQNRLEQSIAAERAEAALVKAKQELEIQASQNRSDIKKARQAIEFASKDLQMFLEGERDFEIEQARQAIDLAREDAERARDRLVWSEKLGEKGFMTSTELEADRIAAHRANVVLEQATRQLELLERFRMPKRESELRSIFDEAEHESERVELQAQAHLVDFESNLRACTATLELEKEKLARLEDQIAKAKILAPRDGYVVYAQRDSDEPPIAEGTEVREREEILSIPSSLGMVATVKLHESVLKQVRVGQSCVIKVDALPGVESEGKVEFVAMLPDRNSRWSNPNLRLYAAEVSITTPHPGMRPGMTCAVEILAEEIPDALYVPVQAVFRSGPRTLSFVATRGEPEPRDVRVGRFNALWVQILEGLDEGDVVLLHAPPGYEMPTIVEDEPDAESERKDAAGAEKARSAPRDDKRSRDG